MEIIENTPEMLILRMPANISLANALRRSVLEVPVLAVDEVEIFKNDSALYDEVLAHRIGLIPLKTEPRMSEKTKIDFKLSKTGPCTVYSDDLKGSGEIIYPKMPLSILMEGDKIELVATASLGRGIDHAKYVPGLCYYRHILEVKSKPEIDKIIQSSNYGWIKSEKKKDKWLCDIDEAEQAKIEGIDKDAISDSDEIIFIIESYGNMPAKDIFKGAIKALESNLDVFEKAIK